MAERPFTPEHKRVRGPANFRQRDLTAMIRAAEEAGKTVYGVELAEGRARLILSPIAADQPKANPWDDED